MFTGYFTAGRNGTIKSMDMSLNFNKKLRSIAPNNNCGTAVTDNTIGTIAWTNPSNATGNDDNFANADIYTLNDVSEYLKVTNFSFSIPSAATILGIKVTAYVGETIDTMDVYDESVKIVKAGVISGAEYADTDTVEWAVDTVGGTAREWGDETSLWGLTWTPADINGSTFGVAISAKHTGGTVAAEHEVRVYKVNIKIYYSLQVTSKWQVNPKELGWEDLTDTEVTTAWKTETDTAVLFKDTLYAADFTNDDIPMEFRLVITCATSDTFTVTVTDSDCYAGVFAETQ
jgi:hypothetical protein